MNHRNMIQALAQPAGNLEAALTPQWLENLARIHADTVPPDTVTRWLENLTVLSGVPLDYLVPDEQMLPGEALRFFQVDPQWIYSLIEGAYSIGRVTTSERVHDQVTAPSLYQRAAPNLYNHITRKPDTTLHDEPAPYLYSGFLLRSSVVSGWPGLRVTVRDRAQKELKPILFSRGNDPSAAEPGADTPSARQGAKAGRRITPDILLYLVEGSIDAVTFQEPNEGLHFGLDKQTSNGAETLTGSKSLRYANVPKAAVQQTPPGVAILADKQPVTVPLEFRPRRNVLKINEIAQKMADKLPTVQGNNRDDGTAHRFTPAEFALEMIEGVEGVTIHITPKAGG